MEVSPLFRYIDRGVIVHVRGVSWERLRKPARWHRCQVDTYAINWRHMGFPNWIHRCRCGARRDPTLGIGLPPWLDRNSRRSRRVHYYLPLD